MAADHVGAGGASAVLRLGDVTWIEAAAVAMVLVVPLGSCEQHGPHLPLDTDTRIATALAERLCGRGGAGAGVLVLAPAITITASGEHAGFAGTLSIGTAALASVLVELARSADWACGVVFVNGHGGNLDAVTEAVATTTSEGRRALALWPKVPDGDAHAGRTETSLLLAIDPGAVRLGAAEAGHVGPLRDVLDDLRAGGVAAVSPNGVLGDPAGASADEGRDLLERLVDDLVAELDAWADAGGGVDDADRSRSARS